MNGPIAGWSARSIDGSGKNRAAGSVSYRGRQSEIPERVRCLAADELLGVIMTMQPARFKLKSSLDNDLCFHRLGDRLGSGHPALKTDELRDHGAYVAY